jgi:flagellar biosynthesis protein FlhB
VSDAGEKPFDPTPQRLERAKREGNVARAGELPANAAFAAAGLALAGVVPVLFERARTGIARAARGDVPVADSLALVAFALVPIAAGILAALAANVLQSGGLHVAPISIKGERLDPAEGLKRMLSRDSGLHALRAAIGFSLAAAGMVPVFVQATTLALGTLDTATVAGTTWRACGLVAAIACATGLLFAVGEFASARSAWIRKLRMSFDERKREAKDQEGDPHTRGRRRSLHRSLLRGAIARVREASFVVANPTHVAVALEYRPPEVPVPRILVRAADAAALRVRELAGQHGIPVVENVPLARALFAGSNAGDVIPAAHYVAVAEVVAALIRAGRIER